MTRSHGRLGPRLLDELRRIDDGRLPIAEVNRRLGRAAEALGLLRPSYERVRTAVHEQRRLRARPSTFDVLADISMRTRTPEALLDHLSGIALPPLR